jgi:hypothetical protein
MTFATVIKNVLKWARKNSNKLKFVLKHTPISGSTGVVIPASFNVVMSSQETEICLQEYLAVKLNNKETTGHLWN